MPKEQVADTAGMEEGQMNADRSGWKTTTDMLTGGAVKDLGDGGTQEVGYDEFDPHTANKG